MLRSLSLAVCTFTLVVIASALLLGTMPVRGVSAAAPRQSPEQCAWVNRAAARPKVALVGEEITVTLSLASSCPDSAVPMHVVLVMDASGSMAGQANLEIKKAARNLIQRLNMKDNPATKVGVVTYNRTAKILCKLTNESGVANGCVGQVGAAGQSQVATGLAEALVVLGLGRRDVAEGTGLREVIVLMSDSVPDCDAALVVADRAKEQGVLVAAVHVCVAGLCEDFCLPKIADGPETSLMVRDIGQLSLLLADHRSGLLRGSPFTTMISATVPSAFFLVSDSAVPESAVVAPGGRGLTWITDQPPVAGMTVTWQLRVLEPGMHDVGVLEASAGVLNGPQTLAIHVLAPRTLALEPRELATATPSVEPSATPDPVPTGVPTQSTDRVQRLYLPATIREKALR